MPGKNDVDFSLGVDLKDLIRGRKQVDQFFSGIKATAGQISTFSKLKRETQETEARFKAATQEVNRLTKELKNVGATSSRQLDIAKRTARQAKNQYISQRNSLNDLRKELNAAGVNTAKLASENRRLKREIEAATKAQEQQNRAASTTARRSNLGSARNVLAIRSEREIRREIRQTRAAFRRLADSGKLSGREISIAQRAAALRVRELKREIRGANREFRASGSSIAAFATGGAALFATIRGVQGVINTLDEFTRIQGLLRLTIDSEEELATTTERLFKVAQDTRSVFGATSKLYARLARNADELNLSQANLEDITTSVNRSLKIGGATSQEAAAGVIQLGQALASGELRGDEFRSIAENMPRLANAIADGLKKSLGSLRAASKDGLLTSDVVVQSILSQSALLEEEFEKLPKTVADAWTQIANEIDRGITKADTRRLVDSMDDLREIIASPEFQQAFTNLANGIISALTSVLDFITGVDIAISEIIRKTVGPIETDIESLNADLLDAQALLADIREGGFSRPVFEIDEDGVNFLPSEEEVQAKIDSLKSRIQELRESSTVAANAGVVDAVSSPISNTAEELVRLLEQNNSGDKLTDSFDSAIESMRRSVALIGKQKEEERILYEIQNGRFRDLNENQKESLLQQARIIDQRKREVELEKILENAEQRLFQLQGRTLDARLSEINSKYTALIDELGAESENGKLLNKLFDIEVARANFDNLADEYSALIEQLRQKEQELANEVQIGVITETEATRQLIAFRQETLGQLGELITKMQQLAEATGNPALIANVSEMRSQVKQLATESSQAQLQIEKNAEAINRSFASGATSELLNFIDQTKGAKEAFLDFSRNFLRRITEMILQQQVLNAISNSGTGGLGAAVASVFHAGGRVGGAAVRRRVPAEMFLSAPRYHQGGVAGLKPNEVPAILERGETVFPKNSTPDMPGVTIVNLDDSSKLDDYLDSSRSDRVFVNKMQRLQRQIKQVLT